MANSKQILLVGAGIGLVALVASRVRSIKQTVRSLEFDIRDLRLNIKNILRPEVIFTISIFNPNREPVPVTAFFGSVTNGNTTIANFNNASPVTIDGGESATIDVAARISAVNIVTQVLQKASFKQLTVAGVVKTTVLDMPFQKQINMPAIGSIWSNLKRKRRQPGTPAGKVISRWQKIRRHPKHKRRLPLFQGKGNRHLIPGTLN